MDARLNMFDNEIAANFGKRFANASMVIVQSSLPQATQELVSLRASSTLNSPGPGPTSRTSSDPLSSRRSMSCRGCTSRRRTGLSMMNPS